MVSSWGNLIKTGMSFGKNTAQREEGRLWMETRIA